MLMFSLDACSEPLWVRDERDNNVECTASKDAWATWGNHVECSASKDTLAHTGCDKNADAQPLKTA